MNALKNTKRVIIATWVFMCSLGLFSTVTHATDVYNSDELYIYGSSASDSPVLNTNIYNLSPNGNIVINGHFRHIKGDLRNDADFQQVGTGTYVFGDGTNVVAQVVGENATGVAPQLVDVQLNNTLGLELEIPLNVSGTFTFSVAGDVVTDRSQAAGAALVLESAASISSAEDDRHVNGYLSKVYSSASSFTFNIGDGSNLYPVDITPGGASDTVTAAFFNSTPSNTSSNTGIYTIYNAGYWDISSTGSSLNQLALQWDSVFSIVDAVADVRVVGFNSSTSTWEVVTTASAGVGTQADGSVSSTSVSLANYSYFAIGIIDSDDDDVPDSIENGLGTNPNDDSDAGDADGDGTTDYEEVTTNFPNGDADGDGIPDGTETGGNNPYDDDDGDGIVNLMDPDFGGGTCTNVAPNDNRCDDGDVNSVFDSDDDGIADFLQASVTTDSDGDGVPDLVEAAEGTNANSSSSFQDSDNDGTPDYSEVLVGGNDTAFLAGTTDADGDGTSDLAESTVGATAHNPYGDDDADGTPNYLDADFIAGTAPTACTEDADSNGICDAPHPFFDQDGDGTADFAQGAALTDTDGDGVPDSIEIAVGTDPNNASSFGDADGNGISDYEQSQLNGGFGSPNNDTDGDGIPDIFEVMGSLGPYDDPDNDGIPAYLDDDSTDPNVGNADGRVESNFDPDGNGIADFIDKSSRQVVRTGRDGQGSIGWWLLVGALLIALLRLGLLSRRQLRVDK